MVTCLMFHVFLFFPEYYVFIWENHFLKASIIKNENQIISLLFKSIIVCYYLLLSWGLTDGQFDFELDSSSANQGGDDCSMNE